MLNSSEILDILLPRNDLFHRNLCRKYIRDEAEVDDCLHEGYRKFLECGRQFGTQDEGEKFLCRLLVNHFIDWLRRMGTSEKRFLPLLEDRVRLSQPGAEPETAAIARQKAGFHHQAISEVCRKVENLPGYQREIIFLLFLREPPMSLREICAVKKIPFSTLQSRVRSAMGRLRGLNQDLLREVDKY